MVTLIISTKNEPYRTVNFIFSAPPFFTVDFIDEDGNLLVPKMIRPIIEYDETRLGASKGAIRQYRHQNLHVREYPDHYSVHIDRIDPRTDPLGHLLVDAPEYLTALAIMLSCLKNAKNLTHINHHGRNLTCSTLC
jgi:hypothetical protein